MTTTDKLTELFDWIMAHKASVLDGMSRREQAECIEAVEAWEKGEKPKADFHAWLAKARAALSTPTEERQ